MSPIVHYAIPAFIVTLLIEMWILKGRDGYRGYETKDTFASLAMGIGNVLLNIPSKAAVFAMNVWLYQYAVVDWGDSWLVWPALFIAEDFCYYWFHRMHHEVRFMWAGHVNHHSSQHYNLSTALRQAWTTVLTGPWFWIPLPLLGFSPEKVLTAQAVSLLYQYWIHTELIQRMGPFEWIFNTPSHHRVHHGSNGRYLDRNHGGILIIWDRLFGTYEREEEPVVFGLTTNIQTFNPLRIGFHEWAAIGRDVAAAPSIGSALGYIFGPPGWSHDGSRQTSKQIRAGGPSSSAVPNASSTSISV